jgi:hypothetical protein
MTESGFTVDVDQNQYPREGGREPGRLVPVRRRRARPGPGPGDLDR